MLKWRIYVLTKLPFFAIWRKLVLTKIKQFTVSHFSNSCQWPSICEISCWLCVVWVHWTTEADGGQGRRLLGLHSCQVHIYIILCIFRFLFRVTCYSLLGYWGWWWTRETTPGSTFLPGFISIILCTFRFACLQSDLLQSAGLLRMIVEKGDDPWGYVPARLVAPTIQCFVCLTMSDNSQTFIKWLSSAPKT